MRHVLWIAMLVGCVTEQPEQTQETTVEQSLLGRCKAVGPIETFDGGWEDITLRRCCHGYQLQGRTFLHCVECGGASGWTCQ